MDSFAPATTTALYKFNGPSALRAVEGRHGTYKYNRFVTFHDKIQEIGGFFIVSVPWVITIPSMSFLANNLLIVLASVNHTSSVISCEPILTICSPVTLAIF